MNNSKKIYNTTLRILLPKEMKVWIEKSAKEGEISEAEVVRNILEVAMNKKQ